MLIRTLRALRLGLRGSAAGKVLRKLGLSSLGRRLYERRLLGQGVHEIAVLGSRLRFAICTEREVTRLDAIAEEEAFIARMLEHVRAADFFFDVGANIGLISLIVADRHRADGVSVHAFEPEPHNAAELRRNIGLNGLTSVTVHEIALGASGGTAPLYVGGKTGSGAHSLIAGHTESTVCIDVPVMTAAQFAREFQVTPHVVKIDVEGAEMAVLHGMDELLQSKQVREIFVEVHRRTLIQAGTSAEAMGAWLAQRGYRLAWTMDRGEQSHQHYQAGMGP